MAKGLAKSSSRSFSKGLNRVLGACKTHWTSSQGLSVWLSEAGTKQSSSLWYLLAICRVLPPFPLLLIFQSSFISVVYFRSFLGAWERASSSPSDWWKKGGTESLRSSHGGMVCCSDPFRDWMSYSTVFKSGPPNAFISHPSLASALS